MINKNQFKTVNNKKILHKVGKQWKVFSIAFLLALGATGAAATANAGNVSAHAIHKPAATKTIKSKPKRKVARLSATKGKKRSTKKAKKTTKKNRGSKKSVLSNRIQNNLNQVNNNNSNKHVDPSTTPQYKSQALSQDIKNWAASQHLNNAQTAAIMANAQIESDNGNAFKGANFGDFLGGGFKGRVNNQASVNKYMNNFVKKVAPKQWRKFKSMRTTTPTKLGNYFSTNIERSAIGGNRSGKLASQIYRDLKNNDVSGVATAAKKAPTSNASNTSANNNQLDQSVSTEHIDWNSLSPKVQSMYLSLTAAPSIQTPSGVSQASVDNDVPVYFADGAVRTVMDNMPSNVNNGSANVQTASKKQSNSPLAVKSNAGGATLVAKGQTQSSSVQTAAKKAPTSGQAKIATNGGVSIVSKSGANSSNANAQKKSAGVLSQGSSASTGKNSNQGTLTQQSSTVKTAAKKAPSASSSAAKGQAKVVEVPQTKTATKTAAKKPGYTLNAGASSTSKGSTKTTPASAVTINLSQNLDGSKGIQNKVNSVVNAYQAKAATKSNADVNDLQKKMGSVAKDENAHIAQVPQKSTKKANGFTQLASTVSQNKAGFAKTLLKAPQAHVVNMSNAQASEAAKSLKNNNSLDNAISKFTNNSSATQSQSASSGNQQSQSQSNPFLDPNNSVNTGTDKDKKQTNTIKQNYQAGAKAAQKDAANANKQGNANFK